MIKKPPTVTSSIRLPEASWKMFRRVLVAKGRAWLMRFIEREHSKLPDIAPPKPRRATGKKKSGAA